MPLLLLFASTTLPLAADAQTPQADTLFDLQSIAPGVWVAVLREREPFAITNSLIVVSEDGVLVVDTQQSEPAVQEVIARIRELTDRPVRWVVNTHAHLDHVGGNDAYVRAFGPEVQVLGHVNTREAMEVSTRAALQREVEWRSRDLAEQRGRLRRMRESLLDPEITAATERGVERLARYMEDLRRLELRPPDVTFQGDHVLRLGEREVHLLHPGPAHTRGDVAVWLPAEGILAAGDLVEQGISIVGEGATPTGWAAALDSLARLDVEHLVPAHGPVQDRRLLDRQRDLFGTLVRETRRARAGGFTLDDAWGRIENAAETALRGEGSGLPVPRAIFLLWMEAALPRAWEEAGGGG